MIALSKSQEDDQSFWKSRLIFSKTINYQQQFPEPKQNRGLRSFERISEI